MEKTKQLTEEKIKMRSIRKLLEKYPEPKEAYAQYLFRENKKPNGETWLDFKGACHTRKKVLRPLYVIKGGKQ